MIKNIEDLFAITCLTADFDEPADFDELEDLLESCQKENVLSFLFGKEGVIKNKEDLSELLKYIPTEKDKKELEKQYLESLEQKLDKKTLLTDFFKTNTKTNTTSINQHNLQLGSRQISPQ